VVFLAFAKVVPGQLGTGVGGPLARRQFRLDWRVVGLCEVGVGKLEVDWSGEGLLLVARVVAVD